MKERERGERGGKRQCKGGGRGDYRVQSSEYGGETGAKVQIGAELLCKGGKVNEKTGRGGALPRPPCGEVKAKPCPYPRAELANKEGARLARSANPTRSRRGRLGQHEVRSLPGDRRGGPVGLHPDFDFLAARELLAAARDDLVDVDGGFMEEAFDAFGDGFVFVC